MLFLKILYVQKIFSSFGYRSFSMKINLTERSKSRKNTFFFQKNGTGTRNSLFTSDEQNDPPLKFVYVIDSPTTTTIDKLIINVQDCMINQLGCRDIHLVQLTTDDGYLLMKQNICAHVLNNNDKLMCIDMQSFINDNRHMLSSSEEWLSLQQHDASDDKEKNLRVGVHDNGKLYISMYGDENTSALYIFTFSELLTIARAKRQGK
jgi:hypothetical protein